MYNENELTVSLVKTATGILKAFSPVTKDYLPGEYPVATISTQQNRTVVYQCSQFPVTYIRMFFHRINYHVEFGQPPILSSRFCEYFPNDTDQ